MPKISVIIPTHNRPELLKEAISSVLAQTYRDFEIIVIDDGLAQRADRVIDDFNDPKIKYIKHEKSKGGAAARNTGIKNSTGEFIAFLDDDDKWLTKKLEIQMGEFENTPPDVGFSFTAVKNIKDKDEFITQVPEGVDNYFNLAIEWFKGFLTVTLIIKRKVLDYVGYFDEEFPSHQESELMIRVSKKYKGLGINKPLTVVNMKKSHDQVGGNLEKRIAGREMILKKHIEEFKRYPRAMAGHYFGLGLLYRDNGQYKNARRAFMRAIKANFMFRYIFHFLSMAINGLPYKFLRKW